jgi:HAD superfamily hydrolase (TIGR01509 family)
MTEEKEQKIKAIMFDQDGTILDSEAWHIECEQTLFKKYGINISNEEHRSYQGLPLYDILTQVTKGKNIKKNIDELVEEKRVMWKEQAKEKIKIFDGFYELIDVLEKKYKIALVTSASYSSREFIKRIFPDQSGIFDVEITADDVLCGKPNPEPYLIALERLGLKPEESIAIEDSFNGITSAKKAKVNVIAIANSHSNEELKKYHPNAIVQSLKEINLGLIKAFEK